MHAFALALCVSLPSPSDLQTQEVVKRLGSSSFAEREDATKTLKAMGTRSLRALRKAMVATDPEIRKRAARLVKELERSAQSPEERKFLGQWQMVSETLKDGKVNQFPNGAVLSFTNRGVSVCNTGRPVSWDAYTATGGVLTFYRPSKTEWWRYRFDGGALLLNLGGGSIGVRLERIP